MGTTRSQLPARRLVATFTLAQLLGTYPVTAKTGTPRGGGERGLYFSFSKGIKSCLYFELCVNELSPLFAPSAVWCGVWCLLVALAAHPGVKHGAKWFLLCSGSWFSSRLAFAVPFSMLVLSEYLQPQLLLSYFVNKKVYRGYFFRTISKEVLCEGKHPWSLRLYFFCSRFGNARWILRQLS